MQYTYIWATEGNWYTITISKMYFVECYGIVGSLVSKTQQMLAITPKPSLNYLFYSSKVQVYIIRLPF